MSYLSFGNKNGLNINENEENFNLTNSYSPDQILNNFQKEEYYNPIEHNYSNNNSLSNFQGNTTKMNSKSKTQKSLTKEVKVLYIDIKENPDENPVGQINLNTNISKQKRSVKKCGRKRIRNVDNQEEHSKFSDDNIRRKCKHLLLKNLLKFVNERIKIIYDGRIGNSIFIKELKIINQKQKSDASIRFNKLFLNKILGDIFSEDISKKYTNLPLNHNKILINNLINDEDEYKKIYFVKLFNLTFTQCLNHFIGKEYIPILGGLKCFVDIKDDIIAKYEDGEEYVQNLEHYLNNFKEIIEDKRPRKLRNKIF